MAISCSGGVSWCWTKCTNLAHGFKKAFTREKQENPLRNYGIPVVSGLVVGGIAAGIAGGVVTKFEPGFLKNSDNSDVLDTQKVTWFCLGIAAAGVLLGVITRCCCMASSRKVATNNKPPEPIGYRADEVKQDQPSASADYVLTGDLFDDSENPPQSAIWPLVQLVHGLGIQGKHADPVADTPRTNCNDVSIGDTDLIIPTLQLNFPNISDNIASILRSIDDDFPTISLEGLTRVLNGLNDNFVELSSLRPRISLLCSEILGKFN